MGKSSGDGDLSSYNLRSVFADGMDDGGTPRSVNEDGELIGDVGFVV